MNGPKQLRLLFDPCPELLVLSFPFNLGWVGLSWVGGALDNIVATGEVCQKLPESC